MIGARVSTDFSAIVVKQWLEEWESIDFDEAAFQARPPKNFLMTSIPARTLRRLSNTYRRTPGGRGTSIQRRHDESRSEEIARFVRDGYPLSSLSSAKRASTTENLRKPGWLPTAIVVNILDPAVPRADRRVANQDALRVKPVSDWVRGEALKIELPESWTDGDWQPEASYPIEVIDGQHRLWSFIEGDEDLEYDLPVVAFFGLDISWQAYLFWTINIKPKKINASLAYDLYPLLRDQEWLRQGEGIDVYRETRAQELTEVLWSTADSPWHQRINMLGETGVRARMPVTQASFVRSLSESFVRPWNSRSSAIGGLFGGASGGDGLSWTRAQQGAFLLTMWAELQRSVEESDSPWVRALAALDEESPGAASAFTGPLTLLAADQGIRAFHQAVNDILWMASDDVGLRSWQRSSALDDISSEAIDEERAQLDSQPFRTVLTSMTTALAKFDWRNSKAPAQEPMELSFKQSLRGTGGYKLLRDALFNHLSEYGPPELEGATRRVIEVRT